VLFCVTSGSDFAKGADAPPASLPAWPFQIGAGQRPGTYWWCPGSAFTKDDIDYNLQRFRDGGFGFVHMIPIYGARGAEDRDITYLSPQWMEMLNHTVRTGARTVCRHDHRHRLVFRRAQPAGQRHRREGPL
jgi:hypothetical protein